MHLLHAVMRPQPVPIQTRRPRRRKRELMPSNVVRMRVRNKAPPLPPANVDAQLGRGDKQAGVVVKHAEGDGIQGTGVREQATV